MSREGELMGLHRLLGLTTAVPNPEELAAFYGELGLARDGDVFSGSNDGATVKIEEGAVRRLVEVSVGVSDELDLASIALRLRDGGAEVAEAPGQISVVEAASHVRFIVKIADQEISGTAVLPPEENTYSRAVRRNRRAEGVYALARSPRRLGHLVIGSPDRTATRDFIVEGLGFRASDEIDGVISFLRCSTEHHNIAVVESEVPILQHYSFECDSIDHVGALATSLLRWSPERHVWGFGRHFAGSNYYWYLRDASGSFIELYSDMDIIDDEDEWEARGRTAFEFEHVANAWGPNLPLEFVIPADLEDLKAKWATR